MNNQELIALVQDRKWGMLSELVQDHKWSTLRRLNKAVLRKEKNKGVSDILKQLLLTYSPYTEEVEKTYRHLFGTRLHLKGVPHTAVAKKYHDMYQNPSRLYYEMDRGMLKINHSEYNMMMIYYGRFVFNYDEWFMINMEKWSEVVNQLLLRGENMNIQDDSRNTMLHHMIMGISNTERMIAERMEEERDPDYDFVAVLEERKDNIYEMIAHLLAHGADPLLTGGEHNFTAIEMVEEMINDQSSIDRLIVLMQPYC